MTPKTHASRNMNQDTVLQFVLKRDRVIVLAGLLTLSVLAWIYLMWDARTMSCMSLMDSHMRARTTTDFGLMFIMWVVMMVAMMVPSVAPMVLMFAAINRTRREQERPFVSTAVFLSGYLAAWITFSALATMLQWALHTTALLSSTMTVANPWMGALLLVAAGIFQWTPLKRACLTHCRTPLNFLMTEWQEGAVGAFMMGWRHGLYCLGCCWILMTLLFVAGVMNLLWVAAISVLVLVEKVVPSGRQLSAIAGVVLVGWGAWMAASSLLH